MNSVTCSSVSPSIFISTVFCCFPIVIVLVFSTLILSPNLWLLLCTSSVSSCSCPSSSSTRSMSSANLRLLTVCPPTLAPASVDFKAKLIIASRIRLNRCGDSPHPCLTFTVNLSEFPVYSHCAQQFTIHIFQQFYQLFQNPIVPQYLPQSLLPHTVEGLSEIYEVVICDPPRRNQSHVLKQKNSVFD